MRSSFSLVAWVGENVRIADRETGRLAVKRLPSGQVNERERKDEGDEDKSGIQIKVIWRKWRVLGAAHV